MRTPRFRESSSQPAQRTAGLESWQPMQGQARRCGVQFLGILRAGLLGSVASFRYEALGHRGVAPPLFPPSLRGEVRKAATAGQEPFQTGVSPPQISLPVCIGVIARCREPHSRIRLQVRHPVSTSVMANGSDQCARPTLFAEKQFADSHRRFFMQADPGDRVG